MLKVKKRYLLEFTATSKAKISIVVTGHQEKSWTHLPFPAEGSKMLSLATNTVRKDLNNDLHS